MYHRKTWQLARRAARVLWTRSWRADRQFIEANRGLQQFYLKNQFDLVFDVGAHRGEYASKIRALGYRGRIVSVEPNEDCIEQLESSSQHDPQWEVVRLALGDKNGTAVLKIADRTTRSSLQDRGESRYAKGYLNWVAEQTVELRRFETLFEQYSQDASRILLKLDVQGFEREVLSGAQGVLDRIDAIQLEIALLERYANEDLLPEVVDRMRSYGFGIAQILPGKTDPASGLLVQVDGLFIRAPRET